MTDGYESDTSFRTALEQRLKNQAAEASISLDRLRRRVTVERLLARLQATQPGQWVLKGGMALEVRLDGVARATKDLDLGLRMAPPDGDLAVEMLAEALATDVGDRFRYALGAISALDIDGAGDICRGAVSCTLAGKPWGAIKVDIGIRTYELAQTELLSPPGALCFAGIEPPVVETISLPRHVAEKYHAMLLEFGDRENTRTRDLVDIVLLEDHGLIDGSRTAQAIREVFEERSTALPTLLPELPASWASRYEAMAVEHNIEPTSFPEAVAVAAGLWIEFFPTQET